MLTDLLKSGINDEQPESDEYNFLLSGDISQMSNQKDFLLASGFDVQQRNVYPALMEKDVPKALKMIWEKECDGWWHYKDRYIQHGICTEQEFKAGKSK